MELSDSLVMILSHGVRQIKHQCWDEPQEINEEN